MKINSATTIFFSPTGTTKKIINTVIEGIEIDNVSEINITKPIIRNAKSPIIQSDIVLIGVPVYAATIPDVIYPFLESLKGNGKPVVLIAVYGNISEGTTLNDLNKIVEDTDFKVVAAASFIAEHSFSTNETRIAKGRPDLEDLSIAKEFGVKIKEKLQKIDDISDALIQLPKLKNPISALVLPKESAKMVTYLPNVNKNLCNNCGACANLCPVNAIDKDTLEINNKRCIRCFSCVKKCPKNAREIKFRPKIIVSNFLKFESRNKMEPKIYL